MELVTLWRLFYHGSSKCLDCIVVSNISYLSYDIFWFQKTNDLQNGFQEKVVLKYISYLGAATVNKLHQILKYKVWNAWKAIKIPLTFISYIHNLPFLPPFLAGEVVQYFKWPCFRNVNLWWLTFINLNHSFVGAYVWFWRRNCIKINFGSCMHCHSP